MSNMTAPGSRQPGEIQKIGFLEKGGMQILGLLRSEQHHYAVERFAQLRAPLLVLRWRDSAPEKRQKADKRAQSVGTPHDPSIPSEVNESHGCGA